MAFIKKNFEIATISLKTWNEFHYISIGDLATVTQTDYFLEVIDLLQIGDVIKVQLKPVENGAITKYFEVIVKEKTATSIDTFNAHVESTTLADAG